MKKLIIGYRILRWIFYVVLITNILFAFSISVLAFYIRIFGTDISDHYDMFYNIGMKLFPISGVLWIICIITASLQKKVLEKFFLKGCYRGENVYWEYNIDLQGQKAYDQLLPPIKGIFFYQSDFDYYGIYVVYDSGKYNRSFNYFFEVPKEDYEIRKIEFRSRGLKKLEDYIEVG